MITDILDIVKNMEIRVREKKVRLVNLPPCCLGEGPHIDSKCVMCVCASVFAISNGLFEL